MAMKYGCTIYMQKCFVTLEWPLCYISNIGCVADNLCNVPSDNNSARESALKILFREQKCPFFSSSTMPFFNPEQNTGYGIPMIWEWSQSWRNEIKANVCFISSWLQLSPYRDTRS